MDSLTKQFKTTIKRENTELYIMPDKENNDTNRKKLLYMDYLFKKLLGKQDYKTWDSNDIEIDEVVIDWEVCFHNNLTVLNRYVEDDTLDIPQEKGLCLEIVIHNVLVVYRIPFIDTRIKDTDGDGEGEMLIGWSEKILKDHNVNTNHIKYIKELDEVGECLQSVSDIKPNYVSVVFGDSKTNYYLNEHLQGVAEPADLGYFINIEIRF